MSRVAIIAAVVLATLVGLIVLWQLWWAVLLFLLSLALSAALRPSYEQLVELGWPKALAMLGTYVLILVTFVFLVGLSIARVTDEFQRAPADFRELNDHLVATWSHGTWLQQSIVRTLPPPEQFFTTLVGRHGAEILQSVVGTAFTVLGSLGDFLVVVVLSIYWTLDRQHFERLWLSLVPIRQRTAGREIGRAVESEAGAYIRSELVQSLLAGMVLWLIYQALGLHYAATLAVLAALARLIPWVGALLSLAGLAILTAPALVLGEPLVLLRVGIALVLTIGVFAALELVVEPRLFDRRRYNMFFIALGILAITDLLGILGLLLGPMLAVAIEVFLEQSLRLRSTAAATQPVVSLEEQLARLRATIDSTPDAPPELASIVERLSALVAEARPVVAEAGNSHPEPPAPAGSDTLAKHQPA